MFDLTNFSKNVLLYSNKNQNILLHFKDENPNNFIKEYILLRSKLYIIKAEYNK